MEAGGEEEGSDEGRKRLRICIKMRSKGGEQGRGGGNWGDESTRRGKRRRSESQEREKECGELDGKEEQEKDRENK